MTANVKQVLNKIFNTKIFDDELYFTGGTALAYYLNHRVSEDIDIVSFTTLNYKEIISAMLSLGATRIQDENIMALRLAGLFPDEYIIKFVLDNVKIEFFQANRPIQKKILEEANFINFENSKLKILDVKSVAKLKLVALLMRNKSRDLFDFGAVLEHNVLSIDEILFLCSQVDNKSKSINDIAHFIEQKKEPIDDEAVYLSESDNKVTLTFEEIKTRVINNLKNSYPIDK